MRSFRRLFAIPESLSKYYAFGRHKFFILFLFLNQNILHSFYFVFCCCFFEFVWLARLLFVSSHSSLSYHHRIKARVYFTLKNSPSTMSLWAILMLMLLLLLRLTKEESRAHIEGILVMRQTHMLNILLSLYSIHCRWLIIQFPIFAVYLETDSLENMVQISVKHTYFFHSHRFPRIFMPHHT